MRVYLIAATHYTPDGKLFKISRAWTSSLALVYLKALTPPPHRVVKLIDEQLADVDFELDCDLVGITAMGPQIARALDLADEFRRRGKKVVMGGTWVTLAPEDAMMHADAVVLGEAEHVWAQLLDDAEKGELKKSYRAETWHDMKGLPRFNYEELPTFLPSQWRFNPAYRLYYHWPVLTARGCPYPCDYCSITTYYNRGFRTRPIDEVVDDFERIARLGGRRVLILDDNPVGNKRYAKELFRAITPLKFRWASQCVIDIARDEELLDLAAKSGCHTLSIGFESINQNNLDAHRKRFAKAEEYAEYIRRIRAKGINVIALIMIGLDEDGPKTVEQTLRWLIDTKVTLLKLFLPVPYPGTPFFKQMQKEGRIESYDWRRYDYGYSVLKLKNFTTDEAVAEFNRLYRGFYSLKAIVQRFWRMHERPNRETLLWLWSNLYSSYLVRTRPRSWGTIS